jgi:hypothetical protein
MRHECPYCDAQHEDDFEVLTENELHAIRCGDCGQTYSLYVCECESCLKDSLFVWRQAPSKEALAMLDCDACGHRLCQS